jgi:3-hydroxybenzoate/4-hydroxybenzoate---CoA ligase
MTKTHFTTTPVATNPMNAVDEILGPSLAAGRRDSIALLREDGEVSFHELDRMANRYGNALRACGTRVGERVVFLLDDSPELVAAYLGAMRVGAVAVALNVRLAAKDLLFTLEDTEAVVLFAHAEFLPVYREIEALLAKPPLLVVVDGKAGDADGLAAFLAGQPERLVSQPMSPDDMAFWIYSSGTTGRPKAAVHSHRDVLVADLHPRFSFAIGAGDRVFTTSKMFFAFALGHSLLGALRCGATVITFRGWPDAAAVGRVVDALRPTVVFSVPTMYRNLLRDGESERAAFRGVRHFVSAGEKLPEPLFQQWLETTRVPILEGFGTSETIFLAIANTPRSYRAGSSGRPLPWAEVQLLDEAGEPVRTPDTPGLLGIRMGSVFARYWKQPELSAKFLRDGWYFPGDMFSFDADGWWYHQGRADDMLKISGQWVSPSEIEECALRMPELADVAVVGVGNDDGLVRLAMFVVPRHPVADEAGLASRITETLRRSLSIYKCPRTVRFIDELPRTATGKTQRFKLKQLLEQGAVSA